MSADQSVRRRIVHATRRALEALEPRVMLSTTVFSDGFESGQFNGWTLSTSLGGNVSTRWGLNTLRASAGSQSAYASAIQGGQPNANGYQNNQHNAIVRENVSLAGYKLASLSFDYFINTESGYDTFGVVVVDSAGTRTTVFTDSGNFAGSGFRNKNVDLTSFAGQSNLDIEFRIDSDTSVTNDAGGVWIDSISLNADADIPPGSISGRLFNDANGNKTKESSETALGNWRVYLDQNRNGVRDANEATKLTDSGGNYSFTNLAPGTYYIAQEIASGYMQTSPGASGITTGSAFKIDVTFPDTTITPGQRAAFTEAANRWSQIIVGDLPDISDGGTIIDDLRITVTAPRIDGRGGILGHAAPTGFRSGSSLPFKGFMEFDAEDLAQLESDGTLTRVILHEMAHVLGLGTIWIAKGLLFGSGTSDPRFIGSSATAAYNAIFGTANTGVPVESLGSGGTPGTHWRESSLGNELMTGFLNGGSNPISRITVGSMADLGYAVSYNAADPYTATIAGSATLSMGPSIYADGLIAAPSGPKTSTAAVDQSSVAAATPAEITSLAYAYTVFVDVGATRTGVDFGSRPAAPTGSIAGTVFNDLNGNGVKDTGEPGQSNWRVYIDANQNGSFDSTEKGVFTGTGGTYSFTGLAAGTYKIREVEQSTWSRTSSSPTVTLVLGQAATGKNFSNFKNASIAGRVFNDADSDGTQDAGEGGLAGLRVYDDKNGNGVFDTGEINALTNSSGDYTLIYLSAGTRTVRVVLPSGRSFTHPSSGSHIVKPMSGQVITGKRFGTRTV